MVGRVMLVLSNSAWICAVYCDRHRRVQKGKRVCSRGSFPWCFQLNEWRATYFGYIEQVSEVDNLVQVKRRPQRLVFLTVSAKKRIYFQIYVFYSGIKLFSDFSWCQLCNFFLL